LRRPVEMVNPERESPLNGRHSPCAAPIHRLEASERGALADERDALADHRMMQPEKNKALASNGR